jgi:hypothetical protein
MPRTSEPSSNVSSSSAGPRARHSADDRALLGWEEGSTPAEGWAESVPEAGGTGAEAVATPTTRPAGHDAESPVKLTASTGGDRVVGRRTSCNWPPRKG